MRMKCSAGLDVAPRGSLECTWTVLRTSRSGLGEMPCMPIWCWTVGEGRRFGSARRRDGASRHNHFSCQLFSRIWWAM